MDFMDEFQAYYDENCYEKNFPQELVEKYVILKCLKHTEDCETLLMKERSSDKKVVAKCYTKYSFFYSQEEEEALKNIGSSVLPRFEGEYKDKEHRCICREYIEGIPLDEYMIHTHVTSNILRDIAIGLANTMKSLHDSKPSIIHRDIKPSNIIIKQDGSVALIDFGISRVSKENAISDTFCYGTEGFAPPEQFGFMQTDVCSDIYSFGIVLSWMLTGKVEPITNPSSKLEKIAAKCCRFSPNQRYHNDNALINALNKTTKEYALHMQKRIFTLFLSFFAFTAIISAGLALHKAIFREQEAVFKEPLIEEAVRASLDRPKGIITYKDLENVAEIYIQGENVYTSEEEYYSEGGKWYAAARESRVFGPITDLSDLKNMPGLRKLFIGANHINDISPLKNLKQLEKVVLCDNDIESISPLANMETLIDVNVMSNKLNDINAVSTWPDLKLLNLSETGSYDASPVGNLKYIERLDIRNDSNAYQYLNNLYVSELCLGAAGQTDLECIKNVSHVDRLFIRWSEIRNISALEGREDIVYLNMDGCPIEDYRPLFTMPNLTSIEVNADGKNEIEKLISVYGEPTFEIICTQ